MKLDNKKLKFFINKAVDVRKDIISMKERANVSHSGSALSVVEILVALYFGILNINPKKPWTESRDRLILSKGHAGAALYATLSERGYFDKRNLEKFCRDGSKMPTHPERALIPGVEATTGSLGHGLSLGVGMALNGKYYKKKYKVFVVLSDGECDEGSTWEAIMFSGFKKLDNLVAIIDYNKIQGFGRTEEVVDLEPFKDKWEAFGWEVMEIDGHNYDEIFKSLSKIPKRKNKPTCVIAHTIKGKGVSFMEDKLEWHYKAPIGKFFDQAIRELNIQYEK